MGLIKDIQTDMELASVKMVAEYRSRLLVDALKLCGNDADAEDLVGSVFNEVFSRDGGYDQKKGELYPYLRGVLDHLYARTKRRAVNRGTVAVEPSVLAEDETLSTTCTEDEILARSDHDALRAAIGRLPPDYRDAILLHYFSDLPIAKVARVLCISEGTVKWRLCMARKVLASDLGEICERGKNPLAVLAALFLGLGAVFAAVKTGGFGLLPDSTPAEPVETANQVSSTNNFNTVINNPNTVTNNLNEEDQMMNTNKMSMAATLAAGMFALGAQADGIVGEIIPDDALEFVARQTENGYLYVDELNRTNAVEIFLTSGTWTIPDGVTTFDYFVVGGGGSGASRYGGGGGAGGVIAGSVAMMNDFSSRDLAIVVGTGGAAVTGQSGGKKGAPSEIRATVDSAEVLLVQAFGGGAGLRSKATAGADNNGGSGGGGSYSGVPGGRADAGHIYSAEWIIGEMFARKGGTGSTSTDWKGAGGGGAGTDGGSVADESAGGDGIETFITGKSAWFAGGGGGASGNGSAMTIGGKGGGGAGSGNVSAEAGTPNTGSGGGGLGENGTGRYSGAGGSGIVIIRHLALPTRTDPVTQYKLEVKASKGGKVSGTKSGAYDPGALVFLVAKPKPGYQLVNWTINGVPVSQDEKLFLGLASDTTVVANFELINAVFEWGWADGRKVPEVVVAFTNEIMGVISWEFPEWVKSFDYVVVGGGGSGGSRYGGGGGAGGVITGRVSSVESFASRQLAITVGAGGASVTEQSVGKAGSPSEIRATVGSEEVSLVQTLGGGAGWKSNTTVGDANNGGSGGGGSYVSGKQQAGGQADAGVIYEAEWITGEKFANVGGNGNSATDYKGGGGGGAGTVGGPAASENNGGDGIETFITGKSLWLAGGGGGASGKDSSVTVGGKGGGGAGSGNVSAEAGTPNTGSGGGGVGENGTGRYSGAGGSGIVILRYAYPKPPRGLAIIVF